MPAALSAFHWQPVRNTKKALKELTWLVFASKKGNTDNLLSDYAQAGTTQVVARLVDNDVFVEFRAPL